MATDAKDKGTFDMFSPVELKDLLEASKLYAKTLQRKINTETNPQIKQIHSATLAGVQLTIGRLETLKGQQS